MIARLFIAAALLVLSTAPSALPATKVEWVQRTGTTSGTEAIEMWLRLTVTQLDANPLYLDGTTTSFSASDFENLQERGFARIDKIYNTGSTLHGPGNTFCPQPPAHGCSDPASPWRFQFNRDTNTFFTAQAQPLAAGESRDYLFGTYTPKNGPVDPGTYTNWNAQLDITVEGVDVDGKWVVSVLRLGSACGASPADCAFSRTVTAIPEPETSALMCAGPLGVMLAAGNRRNRRAG